MILVDERLWALFKSHWPQTLTYWSVFFSFGLCIAFLGPTILDLRCQTHSTLQQITWVFFSQQFFLVLGSALGGLSKKTPVSTLSVLCVSTLTISLVFAVIPLCHHVLVLAVAMAISGTAMGAIDTIANLQLVKLYQKDSAVFLQALHLFIGLGALVSPLVADPFLAEGRCVVGVNMTSNFSISPSDLKHLRSTLAGKRTLHQQASHYGLYTEGIITTNVSYAFWIMALINLPVPIAVGLLMYREKLLPCSRPSPRLLDGDTLSSTTSSEEPSTDQGHGGLLDCCCYGDRQSRAPYFFLIHGLGGAVLFGMDGIIGSYAGFLYTYAVSPPLSLPHKTAGCLTSVFWASITAGRLAAIFLSCRYPNKNLITASLVPTVGVIVIQAMLLMLYTSAVFLFIATCVLGLCISSVYPCMLAFTEGILDYKGCATTVLVTSAGTGEMVLQTIVGLLIYHQGPKAMALVETAKTENPTQKRYQS
ncbi:major facilitator superfamily domain-containing protein 4A [Aplochiton taeniatus]